MGLHVGKWLTGHGPGAPVIRRVALQRACRAIWRAVALRMRGIWRAASWTMEPSAVSGLTKATPCRP